MVTCIFFERAHAPIAHVSLRQAFQLCLRLCAGSGSPGESRFQLEHPPPHAPTRAPLKADARTHVVATALLAREHRLLGVVPPNSSAWPGVCGMARSTCVCRCEFYFELTAPFQRWSQVSSQDQQVSNGPRIDGRIYFAPASTSVAQTAYIGDNFFGRLSSSSSLILHERPSRPQVAGQAGQCGHSRVRRHHRFALHTSPASLPCLNPAFPRLR